MKRQTKLISIISLLLLSVAALAQQQDPAHPWPTHEPPADYYCLMALNERAVQRDIHACSCVGMVTSEKLCGESDEETYARVNSSACKSYCKGNYIHDSLLRS